MPNCPHGAVTYVPSPAGYAVRCVLCRWVSGTYETPTAVVDAVWERGKVETTRKDSLHMLQIVAAAMRDNATGLVCLTERPGRHADVIREMAKSGMEPAVRLGMEQGFLDSDGRFVTREEAFQIAAEAGQIRSHTGPDGMLFSEDVW